MTSEPAEHSERWRRGQQSAQLALARNASRLGEHESREDRHTPRSLGERDFNLADDPAVASFVAANAAVTELLELRKACLLAVERIEKRAARKPTAAARLHDVRGKLQNLDFELRKARAVVDKLRVPYEAALRVQATHQHRPHPIELDWKVLPPGGWRDNISGRPTRTHRSESPSQPERLEFLDSLAPEAWYSGSHLGQRLYFVAVFDGVAVADYEDFGNALYYCKSDGDRWRSVFQLHKQDALAAGARRIYHTDGWQERVRQLVGGASA